MPPHQWAVGDPAKRPRRLLLCEYGQFAPEPCGAVVAGGLLQRGSLAS